MPEQAAKKWLKQLPLGECKGNLAQGFKSLRRDLRRAFLRQYPNPLVPAYSIIAKSDESNDDADMGNAHRVPFRPGSPVARE
jgi:hypothetical protein